MAIAVYRTPVTAHLPTVMVQSLIAMLVICFLLLLVIGVGASAVFRW